MIGMEIESFQLSKYPGESQLSNLQHAAQYQHANKRLKGRVPLRGDNRSNLETLGQRSYKQELVHACTQGTKQSSQNL